MHQADFTDAGTRIATRLARVHPAMAHRKFKAPFSLTGTVSRAGSGINRAVHVAELRSPGFCSDSFHPPGSAELSADREFGGSHMRKLWFCHPSGAQAARRRA